jgi:hypothetical protein
MALSCGCAILAVAPKEVITRAYGPVGAVGCPLGARLVGEKLTSLPIVLLALLGVAALTLAILAIVTAAQWALLALTILVVALWAGATLRHAVTPHPRLAVQ